MEHPVFLKTLTGAVSQMQAIPLWGNPPPFPWEKLSKELSKALDQKNLKITHHRTQWLNENQLLEGMGENPLIIPITLSPLPESFFFIMPRRNQKTLTDAFLSEDQNGKGFSDPALLEGFSQYLFLNILDTINRLRPFGDLNLTLGEETTLPKARSLGIDVSIQLVIKNLWGRILCSPESHASFKAYFEMEEPELLRDPQSLQMPLSIHFEIGRTRLPISEWKKAKVGDLVLLETCTYDIKTDKGSAVLVLGNTPLFDVRIKEGQIKILEYALIQEEKSMAKEFSDEDLSEELEEENKPLWAPTSEGIEKEDLHSAGKIPLTLTVEVGRVQMSFEKISQLKPGNVLDLGFGPNPNVYLLVSGKRIAKGELVRLGETLGVKILTIGD